MGLKPGTDITMDGQDTTEDITDTPTIMVTTDTTSARDLLKLNPPPLPNLKPMLNLKLNLGITDIMDTLMDTTDTPTIMATTDTTLARGLLKPTPRLKLKPKPNPGTTIVDTTVIPTDMDITDIPMVVTIGRFLAISNPLLR